MTNFTQVFQPILSWLNRPIVLNGPDYITTSTDTQYSLDSEDDFRSGCRNISHQQQFFSELHSPGRSHNTNYLGANKAVLGPLEIDVQRLNKNTTGAFRVPFSNEPKYVTGDIWFLGFLGWDSSINLNIYATRFSTVWYLLCRVNRQAFAHIDLLVDMSIRLNCRCLCYVFCFWLQITSSRKREKRKLWFLDIFGHVLWCTQR